MLQLMNNQLMKTNDNVYVRDDGVDDDMMNDGGGGVMNGDGGDVMKNGVNHLRNYLNHSFFLVRHR